VETVRNPQGIPTSQKRTFRLTGELLAEGQAAISAMMLQLDAALRIPYQDLVLLHDDGSLSAMILPNAGSLTGVICTQGPGWPNSQGGEYVNQRTFTATFEAEYALPTGQEVTISYTESIRWSGGGPVRTCEPAVEGPAVEFIVWAKTAYEAVQTGKIVGWTGWLVPAAPIWPAKLRQSPVIAQTSPERKGLGLANFETTWEYQFVSATPLIGLPHLPP
jgi:hypothetical protein